MSTPRDHIGGMPTEILAQIVAELDVASAAAFARTKGRFYDIAIPILYRKEASKAADPGKFSLVGWAAERGLMKTLRDALDAGAEKWINRRISSKNSYKEELPPLCDPWKIDPYDSDIDDAPSPGESNYGDSDDDDDSSVDGLGASEDDGSDSDAWRGGQADLPGIRWTVAGYGFAPSGPQTRYWWKPIHLAVYWGHHEAVNLLVHHGADLTGYQATCRGLCGCWSFQAWRPRPYQRPKWTPLHLAICRGHTAIAKTLLTYGAGIDAEFNRSSRAITALHTAAAAGDLELIRHLVEEYSVNVNAEDRESITPLAYACAAGQENVIGFLVSHGADTEVDVKGVTPLLDACWRGEFAAAIELVKHGADVNATMKWNQFTALHMCCRWDAIRNYGLKRMPGKNRLIARRELIDLLIAKGADIEARNGYEETPLLSAARSHCKDAIASLLAAGANLNAVNVANFTPVMLASCKVNDRHASVETIRLLFKAGAAVNEVWESGKTALLLACVFMDGEQLIEAIDIFVEHGADVNVRDTSTLFGDSALTLAFNQRKLAACQHLQKRGAAITETDVMRMLHQAAKGDWLEGLHWALDVAAARGYSVKSLPHMTNELANQLKEQRSETLQYWPYGA